MLLTNTQVMESLFEGMFIQRSWNTEVYLTEVGLPRFCKTHTENKTLEALGRAHIARADVTHIQYEKPRYI